jgi:hypothetical protein
LERKRSEVSEAEYLAQRSSVPAFQLLAAFALENALKGTLVRQLLARGETPIFDGGGRSSAKVWGHELRQLAESVGLTLSRSERFFLESLERSVEWSGRYPGPGKRRYKPDPAPIGSDDHRLLVALIDRIRALPNRDDER